MSSDQRKVCVVSLIGKSQFYPDRNKAWKLNSLIQKSVFKPDPKLKQTFLKKVADAQQAQSLEDVESKENFDAQKTPNGKSPEVNNIQTFYDQKNRVIYVHLESIFDTYNIYELLTRNQQAEDQKTFYEQWEAEQLKHLKSVLLIFSISHIVIISNPSCEIDITYIRFFRLIDSLRNKLMPSLVDLLKSLELPIGREWIYAARPCSPRVLFAFENCPRHLIQDPNSSQILEKFQHELEDQIYNSLRKSYVITNISNNSIFAIPPNQEFVYVHRLLSDDTNINKLLMSNPPTITTNASRPMFQSRSTPTSSSDNDARLFREFVFEHIRTALGDGFNDNIGRTNVAPVFELTTADTWFQVYAALADFFLGDAPKSSKIAAYYAQLKSQIDLDVQFSENRCKKLLQPALGLYQENLPAHYNKHQHQQRLEKALNLYQTNARGPMYNHYLAQLRKDCSNVWLNGRQLCEAVSLTGHNCVLELHRLPTVNISEASAVDDEPVLAQGSESATTVLTTASERSDDETSSSSSHRRLITTSEMLESGKRGRSSRTVSASVGRGVAEIKVRPHTSNIVTLAASNCGEFQRERKDPFELREANFTFYEEFSNLPDVAARLPFLVKHEFAVFKPSVLNAKPAVQEKPPESTAQHSVSQSTQQQAQELSINANLSQGNASKSPINLDTSSSQQAAKNEPDSAVAISTEIYLTGMTHSDSPVGLLPRFSSWSLISIGKYADYNANNGLSQPGFMPTHNYLIPWEIVVSNNSVSSLHDKPSSRKNLNPKTLDADARPTKRLPSSSDSITVRGYIGVEYECPCGHRFICSGPDRPVKLSNNGVVKDDAYKLLNMDMPLYTACPCRNSKDSTPYMAQLMRIYTVTPPGNIQPDDSSAVAGFLSVSIKPRVQPNPSPCPIFWPSQPDPIVLADDSIWVLRLPYIYMGDDGKPYSRPTDFETLNNCKVLKGMFSVTLNTTN